MAIALLPGCFVRYALHAFSGSSLDLYFEVEVKRRSLYVENRTAHRKVVSSDEMVGGYSQRKLIVG